MKLCYNKGTNFILYMSYLAVFTKEKDGRLSVSVPALPGCFSQGDTFEEAKKNIEEAVELYLENENLEENPINEIQFVAPIDVKLK
jgi:predicted RNase H-like HicB family nuclease